MVLDAMPDHRIKEFVCLVTHPINVPLSRTSISLFRSKIIQSPSLFHWELGMCVSAREAKLAESSNHLTFVSADVTPVT